MLHWALAFLVCSLIAGVLRFLGIAGASANIAWILFVVFIALSMVSAIVNALLGKPPA